MLCWANIPLATAGDPIHPQLRKNQARLSRPITIRDTTLIGVENVVTKDIPVNVVAIGDPCKVLGEIIERDFEYYNGDLKIDIE